MVDRPTQLDTRSTDNGQSAPRADSRSRPTPNEGGLDPTWSWRDVLASPIVLVLWLYRFLRWLLGALLEEQTGEDRQRSKAKVDPTRTRTARVVIVCLGGVVVLFLVLSLKHQAEQFTLICGSGSMWEAWAWALAIEFGYVSAKVVVASSTLIGLGRSEKILAYLLAIWLCILSCILNCRQFSAHAKNPTDVALTYAWGITVPASIFICSWLIVSTVLSLSSLGKK